MPLVNQGRARVVHRVLELEGLDSGSGELNNATGSKGAIGAAHLVSPQLTDGPIAGSNVLLKFGRRGPVGGVVVAVVIAVFALLVGSLKRGGLGGVEDNVGHGDAVLWRGARVTFKKGTYGEGPVSGGADVERVGKGRVRAHWWVTRGGRGGRGLRGI
jgi:hypothetical protein